VVVLTAIVMAAGLGAATTPFGLVFIPAIAALVVAGLADGRAGIVRLFARITRWRVAPKWYLAALGIPVAMWLGIDLVGVLLGTPASALFRDLGQVPVVLLVVLLPGLIEEFGWRGYAVPASSGEWPVVLVALVVGVIFLVPHVPLYLPGQIYEDLPLWPLPLLILSGSVLYTWVMVGSGGSALLAGLMHAASNGLTPLSRGIDPVRVWELQALVITVIAVIVVLTSARMRRSLVAEIPVEGRSTSA
jgi:membrane protease YdiL (CAAX protease family)